MANLKTIIVAATITLASVASQPRADEVAHPPPDPINQRSPEEASRIQFVQIYISQIGDIDKVRQEAARENPVDANSNPIESGTDGDLGAAMAHLNNKR